MKNNNKGGLKIFGIALMLLGILGANQNLFSEGDPSLSQVRQKHFYLKFYTQADSFGQQPATASYPFNLNLGIGVEFRIDLNQGMALAFGGVPAYPFELFRDPGEAYYAKLHFYSSDNLFYYGLGYGLANAYYYGSRSLKQNSNIIMGVLGFESAQILFITAQLELMPLYIMESTGNKWGVAFNMGFGIF